MIKKELCDGVSYSFIKTSKFKTTLLSVGFYLPLSQENAANSLCLSLMRTGTKELPDLYSFNRKLASLYGAGITSWTAKNGDSLELRINLTVNDDRFCLDGDGVTEAAGKLLCDMIFSRFCDQSDYPETAFLREKRLLCEKIAGTLNEKRLYAKSRCEEEMCKGEPFGLPVDGNLDDAQRLTQHDVKSALKRLIQTSCISLIVVGDCEPTTFIDNFKNHILSANRNFKPTPKNVVKSARNLQICDEKMPVKQGKLVLGLRSNEAGYDRDTVAMWVMTDMLGGGPHSKLFLNVREKLSLCYYCAARPVRNKGLIFIDSGVEEKNMESAKNAIMNEFNSMVNGDFSENDLAVSKRALIDTIRSAVCDQPSLARWYATRSLEQNPMSPEETCEAIDLVSAEDVKLAAGKFSLDTVYRLLPDGSLEEAEQ